MLDNNVIGPQSTTHAHKLESSPFNNSLGLMMTSFDLSLPSATSLGERLRHSQKNAGRGGATATTTATAGITSLHSASTSAPSQQTPLTPQPHQEHMGLSVQHTLSAEFGSLSSEESVGTSPSLRAHPAGASATAKLIAGETQRKDETHLGVWRSRRAAVPQTLGTDAAPARLPVPNLVYWLRGLPFQAQRSDVEAFLQNVDYRKLDIGTLENGECSGNAFVELKQSKNQTELELLHNNFIPIATHSELPVENRPKPRFVEVMPSNPAKRQEQLQLDRNTSRGGLTRHRRLQSGTAGNASLSVHINGSGNFNNNSNNGSCVNSPYLSLPKAHQAESFQAPPHLCQPFPTATSTHFGTSPFESNSGVAVGAASSPYSAVESFLQTVTQQHSPQQPPQQPLQPSQPQSQPPYYIISGVHRAEGEGLAYSQAATSFFTSTPPQDATRPGNSVVPTMVFSQQLDNGNVGLFMMPGYTPVAYVSSYDCGNMIVNTAASAANVAGGVSQAHQQLCMPSYYVQPSATAPTTASGDVSGMPTLTFVTAPCGRAGYALPTG